MLFFFFKSQFCWNLKCSDVWHVSQHFDFCFNLSAPCLIAYWRHGPWLDAISCPLCRQKVRHAWPCESRTKSQLRLGVSRESACVSDLPGQCAVSSLHREPVRPSVERGSGRNHWLQQTLFRSPTKGKYSVLVPGILFLPSNWRSPLLENILKGSELDSLPVSGLYRFVFSLLLR